MDCGFLEVAISIQEREPIAFPPRKEITLVNKLIGQVSVTGSHPTTEKDRFYSGKGNVCETSNRHDFSEEIGPVMHVRSNRTCQHYGENLDS